MSAWIALTKKEFRLGFPVFLAALIIFSGMVVAAYYMGKHFNALQETHLIAFGIILTVHVFFPLFYLFYSLNYERKLLHLWLHNPMSTAGLILAKFFTGIVYMSITFGLTLLALFLFFIDTRIFTEYIIANNFFGTITLTLFQAGIFMGATFLLFWSIFLTYSQKMNDFLSFLLSIVLMGFISWGYQSFTDLSFIQTLTNWGGIQINDVIGFEFNISSDQFESSALTEQTIFYIGHMLRDLIVVVILFFLSSFIIDKKVEV
ncbi:hypothetical protein [Oceanobacillus sp. CAU 1775]